MSLLGERQVRPVESKSLVEQTAARLREPILKGAYEPAQKLVERRVAADLGVSTIAVREAFALLAQEGLIVRVPRRGAFVAAITIGEARELTRVRVAIEELVAEIAMEQWNDKLQTQAQQFVDQMRKSGRRHEWDRLWELDIEFHEFFWRATGNETLQFVTASLRGRISRYLREASVSVSRRELPNIADVHQTWVDAFASRDVEHAKAVVAEHVRSSAGMVIAKLEASERAG